MAVLQRFRQWVKDHPFDPGMGPQGPPVRTLAAIARLDYERKLNREALRPIGVVYPDDGPGPSPQR